MVVQAMADLMTRDAEGHCLAIIGCGNPNRSNDGVRPAVLALLRSRALPDSIKLYDTGTDGAGRDVSRARRFAPRHRGRVRRRIARPEPFRRAGPCSWRATRQQSQPA